MTKLIKAAMTPLSRERHPDIRFVTFSDADGNTPILSVNQRLGFAERRRSASNQIGPDGLSDLLARRAS